MSAKEMMVASAEKTSVLAEYSQEQIDVLRNHVASPDFTNSELAYGLTVARARNLDPFKKQVYFSKRKKKVGDRWVDAVTVEPTIDGYRVMAERTGRMDGYDDTLWCGADGVWRDAWLESTPPVCAKVVVYRKDRKKPCTAVARFSAYVQTTKEGQPNHVWSKMPDNQLAKCAEALALRKAFPDELGDLYTREEMGQVDNATKFDALPQEQQPRAAKVVTIEQVKPVEVKPAESPPPATVECVPEWIAKRIKPLSGLAGIPFYDLDADDLDLVIEQCTKSLEQKRAAKTLTENGGAWLLQIISTAKIVAESRAGDTPPPQDNDAPAGEA